MISTLHGLYDDRIYWKEALSLKNHGYEVMHLTAGQQEMDFISDDGIRLIQVQKKTYFKNPYLDVLFRRLICRPDVYKRLLQKCEELQADVYHFHDIQINRIGRQLTRLAHKPRVIYDVHEDYYEQSRVNHRHPLTAWIFAWHASLTRRRERSLSKLYDAVIAAYPHIEENFKKYIDPRKLHVIYNYTTLSPEHFVPYDEKIYDAVYIGSMNRFRGGLEIIKAATKIKKQVPNIKILIIGPVYSKRYLKSLNSSIKKYGLQENVILKDMVPYREVEKLLLQSRIGLGIFMPVSIFYFSVQVKTFEYMACGLPVVCSNFGNIHKYVSESKAGISVNSQSPGEIAEVVIRLLRNRKLYDTCSRNGIRAVKENYNWGIEEKKLINIYHNMFISPF